MAKYLDQTGLTYFWGKIKGFVNSREHPVGSVYITISSSFNPANQWGGTWSKIAEGQCLIQAGTTYALGSTGGETTHKLANSEMPSHTHGNQKGYSGYIQNTSGWTNTGDIDFQTNPSASFRYYGSYPIGYTGGNLAHNNMPPYLAVNIWKRTA